MFLRISISKEIFSVTLLLSILFYFWQCISLYSETGENGISKSNEILTNEQTLYYAFVADPNGIVIFRKPYAWKSKIGIFEFKEKFTILKKTDDESKRYPDWSKVQFENKVAYISEKNSGKQIRFEKNPSNGVSLAEATIYKSPFLDSEKLTSTKEFETIEIKEESEYSNSEKWYKVTYNQITGFIRDKDLQKYYSPEIAKQISELKFKEIQGFFLVESKKAKINRLEEVTPFNLKEKNSKESKEEKSKITKVKKNEFLQIIATAQIEGNRYYLFGKDFILGDLKYGRSPGYIAKIYETKSRLSENRNTEYWDNFWISEKEGRFLKPADYTDYSLKMGKVKLPNQILTQIQNYTNKLDNPPILNFQNTKFENIPIDKKKKSNYWVATIEKKHFGRNFDLQHDYDKTSEISFLFQKNEKSYELVFAGYSEGDNHRFVDLDGDGTPEIIDQFGTRGGTEAVLFGMKNGKYSLIHSFNEIDGWCEIKVKNRIIYFTKDILQEDQLVPKTTRFKYSKGKLIQLTK